MSEVIYHFSKSSVAYNPETGEFRWVICYRKPWLNGQIATHPMYNGYLYIKADKHNHSASRLAVKLMTGEDVPVDLVVDHDDRDVQNNRIKNLFVRTQQANLARMERHPGASGILGISIYNRPSGNGHMWRTRMGGKTTYYQTLPEAIAGYATLVEERCGK